MMKESDYIPPEMKHLIDLECEEVDDEQSEESMLDAKLQGIMEERKGCAR